MALFINFTMVILMKTKLHPPIRDQFTMAAMEKQYTSRLIELFGSVALAKQAHNQWVINHPPIHHWTTYNTIAMMEVTAPMLPSERKMMIAEVKFAPED